MSDSSDLDDNQVSLLNSMLLEKKRRESLRFDSPGIMEPDPRTSSVMYDLPIDSDSSPASQLSEESSYLLLLHPQLEYIVSTRPRASRKRKLGPFPIRRSLKRLSSDNLIHAIRLQSIDSWEQSVTRRPSRPSLTPLDWVSTFSCFQCFTRLGSAAVHRKRSST